MKTCPNCSTMMEEVDVSGLPEQPTHDLNIPGFPRCVLYVQAATTLKRVSLKGATFNAFDPTGRLRRELETAAPPTLLQS